MKKFYNLGPSGHHQDNKLNVISITIKHLICVESDFASFMRIAYLHFHNFKEMSSYVKYLKINIGRGCRFVKSL